VAQQLSAYEYDDDMPLSCGSCGWRGRAGDLSRELYHELFDISCPSCDAKLAIVSYPTDEETRAAAAAGHLRAQESMAHVEAREEFRQRFERAHLKGPEQLPEIEGERIDLLWDFEAVEDGPNWTIIRHGDRVIWTEIAAFEAGDHFADVLAILRERYGARMGRLDPTPASTIYLYGDRITPALQRALDSMPEREG
jgi:hypothetical protein